MPIDINTWIGRCLKWSDCANLTWSELIVVDDVFTGIDGGAVSGGQGFINVRKSHVQKEISKLTKQQEEKLITVLVKLHGKDYKQTKEVKHPKVSIEDIQFILKEVKGIKIKILKG